jgi:hypothetical protein
MTTCRACPALQKLRAEKNRVSNPQREKKIDYRGRLHPPTVCEPTQRRTRS